MDTVPTAPVLLAVGGHEEGLGALEFAVAEALRAGCGLQLVHVLHSFPAGSADVMVGRDALAVVGREVLARMAERAKEACDGRVSVTTELVEGTVVKTLVEHSEGARLVVLKRHDAGRIERLVTGSLSNGVAAHAHVPVVSVPGNWEPSDDEPGPVVVGVDDPERADAVVRAGLAAAAERGVGARLVQAWWFMEPYDHTAFTRDHERAWAVGRQHGMARALRSALAEHPDVEVEIVVRHERPADLLVDESRDAELLVIGRRDPHRPLGSHLGPVARTVLRHAHCPVMVVEPTQAARA